MTTGRINILVAATVLLLAAAGGLVLGFTIEPNLASGEYHVSSQRFFLREGHTHGMPIALLNLLVGLLLPRLALGERGRRALAIAGLGAFFLPITLVLRGLTFPSKAFAPLGLVGAACFAVTAAMILAGALRPPRATP